MYSQVLSPKDMQVAIKLIRNFFEEEMAKKLNLLRVSAPLFVRKDSGLNDELTGIEQPVRFSAPHMEEFGEIEIVQSLAKWKRVALRNYGFLAGEGLYANMNAIRKNEIPDETHSIYVDQWDFEVMIRRDQRTLDFLKQQVKALYSIFLDAEEMLFEKYEHLVPHFPKELVFLTSEELLQLYPHLTPKQREHEAARRFGAYFLIGIGHPLSDGKVHDHRAADYDDWTLNGDLIFYNPVLDQALELSSLGIRVDADALLLQIEAKKEEHKLSLPYHQALLKDELPLSFGGGIGQSRICQLLLRTYHIGEVQCSIWPREVQEKMQNLGIQLL